jgi:hypothetical protein
MDSGVVQEIFVQEIRGLFSSNGDSKGRFVHIGIRRQPRRYIQSAVYSMLKSTTDKDLVEQKRQTQVKTNVPELAYLWVTKSIRVQY